MKSENATPTLAKSVFIAEDYQAIPLPDASSTIRSEILMPLEAAAKAIFVKANGLPAYRRATGVIRRIPV